MMRLWRFFDAVPLEAMFPTFASTQHLTIYVDGTLTPENSDGAVQYDVKDMENVSIIGVGRNALLDGIGINIARAINVIARNLTIRYKRISQKDGIFG